MPQSLVTAFSLAEALSGRVNRYPGTNRAAIFEAIRSSFRGAADSDRYATNPCVDHALSQRSTGEANRPHSQAVHNWLHGFTVDRHPNGARNWRKDAVELKGGPEAHYSAWDAPARERKLRWPFEGTFR
jgi:hypothetical protein